MKKTILFLVALIGLISFVNAQNPQWLNYTNGDNISALAEEGDNMWVGTSGGLVKLDKTTGISTFYNTSNSGLPDNYVMPIAIDENGTKWIGTWGGGLAAFDGTNWTTYNSSNSGLPHNVVTSITIDENGTKWIGTRGGGLAAFDGTNWTVYNTSNSGLPDNLVQSIIIDGSGSKWIGTHYGGLAKFDGIDWITYNTSNSGLPNNEVFSVAIDESGTKWIGTFYGGLAVYNEDGIPVSIKENKLTENNVKIFPNPARNKITISTKDGLIIKEINIYNQIGQRVIHKKGISNTVDVSKLRQGMYIVEIEIENMKYRNKLMIE